MSEHRVVIERMNPWGPCAWWIGYPLGEFAWTERGAKRKIRRLFVKKLAKHELRKVSHREVVVTLGER